MKKLIIVGILVMVMAMATPAMAFEKGTIRLGGGTGLLGTGSGLSTQTLDTDLGDLDFDILAIDIGYFITDVIEVAVEYSSVGDGSDDIEGLGLAGKYYFPMGENSLYAGGGLQTFDFGGADGDFFYVTGGYNYMLADFFSIDFYLTIGQGDMDFFGDFDMTDLGVTYSIYFK